ncbi:MAG: heavy metal-associated domain-containing protein [Pseudomonadota bacterium]|nr:heavy metal-associated domain-containing protein [Nevskiales bacterium]MEC9364747.1 heavy metal-associated domain-containing protein [Pseudomonadota bacterium]
MKILLLLFALMLPVAAFAAEQTYRLRVDGLACAYCAYGLEKALMKVDGVEHVDVDFEQGAVIVDTARDVGFSEDQLRRMVNDAGFTLRGVERIEAAAQ